MFLLLPFDSLIVNLLGISLTVLFTLLLVFIIVPAVFGVSFGIRKLYMKTLLKIFAVSCAAMMFPHRERRAFTERMVFTFCVTKWGSDIEHWRMQNRQSGIRLFFSHCNLREILTF